MSSTSTHQLTDGDRVMLSIDLPDTVSTVAATPLYKGDQGTVRHIAATWGVEFDRYPGTTFVSEKVDGRIISVISVCDPLPDEPRNPHGDNRADEIVTILQNTDCIEFDDRGDYHLTLRGTDIANHLIREDTATYTEYLALLREKDQNGAKLAILVIYVNSALESGHPGTLALLYRKPRSLKSTTWNGKYQSELFDSNHTS